jgi:hypothetical protein
VVKRSKKTSPNLRGGRPGSSQSPDSAPPPDDVLPGMIVATFMEEYADEIPQLGRVLKTTKDSIELEWLAGCYSGIDYSMQCLHVTI